MLSPKDYPNKENMTAVFALPADRSSPPRDLEVRPKAVKQWVESLPLAQPLDSARKLALHATSLNHTKVDPDDRVQILESYRTVTGVLFDELDAVYSKAVIPLAPKAKEALSIARQLASQMAIGYRLAIADRSGKLLGFGKKQLPLLMLRTMECYATMLRAAYKSYTAVPEGLWRQVHQLYLDAERERVVAEIVDPETKDAVINVYVECLLLALTDPYRLNPGETDKCVQQIRSARAPVTLGQMRPPTRTGGHFIVPCDQDRPPKPALSANDDMGGPNWRLLDCNPLVDKVRMRLNAVETGNVSATTKSLVTPDTLALLKKLVMLWGDPPKRANRRDPAEGSVAVCVGLKAVSWFVALEPKDAQAEKAMLQQGITVPLQRPDFSEAADMPVFEYDIVNQSEGGLKVRRTGATPHALAVGEVVGLKQAQRPRWRIAVVRWVTVLEEGGLEFGVQFLAPWARTVMVQPTIASAGTQPRQALLLADEDQPDRYETLLAPSNLHSDLREFEVASGGGHVTNVRARSLREKTARFDLFDVSPS